MKCLFGILSCAILSVIGFADRPCLADLLWIEDAESGLAHVIDGTHSSYSLIQSQIVAQGNYAFHLANPNWLDNWFEIDQTLTIQSDTKLFFTSRLNWATSSQIAKVQASTNGGISWPIDLFSQAGDDSQGEGAFRLKEIDLASYSNQQLRFRFLYDFVGGYAYIQNDPGVGWHVDNIQFADEFQKTQYSIGNPSAHEQLYLEYLNRARADALVEANRLAAETDHDILDVYNNYGIKTQDIVNQFTWNINHGCMDRYAQPLSFNAALLTAAQLHTQDQFDHEFQGHLSSANPPSPFKEGYDIGDRAYALGYSWISLAENVYSYAESVAHGHAGFDVDWGDTFDPSDPCFNPAFFGQGMQNPAGHRLNIHNNSYKEVGIGVINGTNGSVGPQLVTQDFGNPGDAAFITGVVYEDLNDNLFYDIGEGRSGVRIDVDGSAYYAISSGSGGYSVPVADNGNYNVSFTGGGYASYFTVAHVLDGLNVKIDYLVSPIVYEADFDGDGDVDKQDLSAWISNFGSGPGADTDGDHDSDGADFLVWQTQFGSGMSRSSAAIAVPEPGSGSLLLLGMIYFLLMVARPLNSGLKS